MRATEKGLGPLPCFVHINKNAGTSMRRILGWNYPLGELLEIMVQGRRSNDGRAKTVHGLDEDVHAAVEEVQERQYQLSCVAANLPFGLHEYLTRPVSYFALMREPVSRCMSYWYFVYRTRADSRMWSLFQSYNFDLRRILGDGAVFPLSNDQVRMLSGSPASQPGEQEFRRAREVIEEHFILVGAVECFDASVSALARKLSWNRLAAVHENKGDKTEAAHLPPDAATYLRDANEWDIRLYEWLMDHYLPRNLQ